MGIPGILQQLMQSSPMMGNIKNMMNMIRGAQNPQAMMNQLLMNNPNTKQVMDLVNAAGGDPQKAFYQLAQQKGINPQDILDMINK